MREVIRRKHYSIRTEQSYLDWIRRLILFHGKRHPAQMAEAEVTGFFTHLARDGGVPASTQNQALGALLFLYKEVLKQELGWRARRSRPTIKDFLFSWLPDSFGVRSRVAIAQ
ncbi:MAG: hypothetical protein DMF08_09805 [Verrucomicrobia bacterium]|nr:MAG: hypothetical protein DMF08_09805 [Verrucomicrobiota bacterium]